MRNLPLASEIPPIRLPRGLGEIWSRKETMVGARGARQSLPAFDAGRRQAPRSRENRTARSGLVATDRLLRPLICFEEIRFDGLPTASCPPAKPFQCHPGRGRRVFVSKPVDREPESTP